MTEGEFHKSIADLLDWVLRRPAVWTTFPAGWGKLNRSTAGRLHGAGLKAGFPDILVFFDGRCIGIELKTSNGYVSDVQKEMFDRLFMAGLKVYICSSAEEVVEVLEMEKFPLRSMEISA